jgi:ferredoxin-NADP reductase
MAILRHHVALDSEAAVHLVYSVRSPRDVLYASELEELAGPHRAVTITVTGEAPGWTGRRGRIDRHVIEELGWPPATRPRCYVCGPTPFVEAVAGALAQMGHGIDDVRTERFGPTGG